MQIISKLIKIGNKKLNVVSLDQIADIKQGIATGDNQYYIYVDSIESKFYRKVDKKLIITSSEIEKIKSNKELKNEIANKGIPKSMFNGRNLVPFDKGSTSDIEEGRLSNYYAPTNFYIDWSQASVNRMKTFTVKDVKKSHANLDITKKNKTEIASRFLNTDYFFKDGITFSLVGLYSPTFRINSRGIFQDMGSCIFPHSIPSKYLLGILCSKLCKYILKCYIINTVASTTDSLKLIPIILEKLEIQKIEKLVSDIISKQKINLNYDFQNQEQIQLDEIIYDIYGLGKKNIDDVEYWHRRRYPKLYLSN